MKANKEKPKVSVCVVTYNQEKYIRQCLQSIVNQETSFEFEVIVSDDCSTDGTQAIVQDFAENYPGVVRPIFHEKNIGALKNYIFVHDQAAGEYIAHMDGDDYAIPGKLQIQTDYLDAHPDCSVVWHRMNVFDDSGTFCVPNLPDLSMYEDGIVHLSDVLEFGSITYHSSTMYRSQSRKSRFIDGELIDWYFNVEFLMSGYGKYLEPILGAYRYNDCTGITRKGNGPRKVQKLYASHLEYYLGLLPEYRHKIFTNSILHFLVDVKNLRLSAIYFLKLAWKSKSLISINVFTRALKRYRRMRPKVL
jgi:glycosyltransferase involved in cell wall biosynthesis